MFSSLMLEHAASGAAEARVNWIPAHQWQDIFRQPGSHLLRRCQDRMSVGLAFGLTPRRRLVRVSECCRHLETVQSAVLLADAKDVS